MSRRRLGVAAEASEIVEVDPQLGAVERIRVAVALERVAEQFAERLNQAVAGAVNPEQEPAPVGGGEETEEE